MHTPTSVVDFRFLLVKFYFQTLTQKSKSKLHFLVCYCSGTPPYDHLSNTVTSLLLNNA